MLGESSHTEARKGAAVESREANGVDLLKTLGACLLAPVVFTVCALLASLLWFYLNFAFTVIRPGILGFIAAAIGAYVGMLAARAACDSWLSGYLHQAVFVVFGAFVLLGIYMYLFYFPFEWTRLSSYAQVIILGLMDYQLFWKAEAL